MEQKRVRGFEYCKNWQCEVGVSLPVRGTPGSAGYDFFCPEEVLVLPGCTVKIVTGVKAYMQPGEVLLLFPRSSYGVKKGMVLANTVGVIDSDFYNNPRDEGNITIALRNDGQVPFTIKKGERFAQGVFMPYLLADNEDVLNDSRNGGIGSTDKEGSMKK